MGNKLLFLLIWSLPVKQQVQTANNKIRPVLNTNTLYIIIKVYNSNRCSIVYLHPSYTAFNLILINWNMEG